MSFEMNRRKLLGGMAIIGAGLPLGRVAVAEDIPSKPEAGVIKMGLNPWLGYGMWHVAQKQGFFQAAGIEKVELVNFTTDAELNAALASGQIDCGNIATHTSMAFMAAGIPIKIIQILDASLEADAMLADGTISSVKDLKGKQVAYEEGTTSHILLNYALEKNGMTLDDVQKVPMPAADAGTALIAGKVPVAVTYEPYITAARSQGKDIKMLFAAAEDPGLISDVLVGTEAFMAAKPGQALALVKAWDAAYKYYEANMKDARAIISEAVGAKPEELETAFDGVKYYSLAENVTAINGDFLTKIAPDVKNAATKAGLLSKDVDIATIIDSRFVLAAAK